MTFKYTPILLIKGEDGEVEQIQPSKLYDSYEEAEAWIDGVHDSADWAQPEFITAAVKRLKNAN